MKCANCSFDNAAEAKFCENCGKPLENNCPNCGKPVAPNAKFCRNCGYHLAGPIAPTSRLANLQQAAPAVLQDKIRDASTKLIGERKLVTVLFTDIVGSTALAEKLDPEDWGEIVSGAHRRVGEAVYRYEGTIAQLLGDGVLAFFGAPVTHEDDPVRAANAALDIQAAMKMYARELAANRRVDHFQMRCGLNTGLVVVGNIGSDLHMEYLAIGDTVNLASRMQSAAEPGTVLVADHTARWIKHAYELESRGELEVKGKTERVRAFRVVAPKDSPASARGIEGLDSPLVGRDREVGLLQTRVDELMHGRGQIVSVMGDAGLGKSRLVAEIRKWIAAERPVQWIEGRSLSYESATPYAPFIDLFSRMYQLRAGEDDAEKYSRIRENVQNITPNHLEIAPFIATILGLGLDGEDLQRVRYLEPPQLREKVFQAVLLLFELFAHRQPIVIMLDDLHWADSVSLDLLERLMALTGRAPVMILALFRPQRQEPSWRIHEAAQRDHAHRYTPIALEPLDESSSRQLVANLLEVEDLPGKVRGLILQKAEGNPFYVEEVIRSLLDANLVVRQNSHWRAAREIENIQVPDTLVGVIGARLDRLDQESKRTAQAAAVVGREFQLEILEEISESKSQVSGALETLERRELIREKNHLPAPAYIFKHALTQETAYASLLLSRRRELHKNVAECLERLAPDHVNDIARHFVDAQENARALPYLVQAGERAARAYSTPEAIGLFTRAIEILKHVVDLDLARRAYEGLGSALLLVFDIPRAVAHYNAMLAYGRENEDIPLQVSALNKLGLIEGQYMGQFEPAEQHLLEAERLAREFEHQPGLAELYTVRCGICTMKGDFGNAARYLTESATIGRELNIKEQEAFGETHTANTLTYMAEFDQAYAKSLDALKVSEEIGNQMHIAEVKLFPIPFYFLHKGDLDQARQSAEEGVQIAHRIGTAFPESLGLGLLAQIAHLRGEYENAFELLKRTDAAAQASGLPFMTANTLAAAGLMYLEISEKYADKTKELYASTLKAMENPMAASAASSALADLGFCELANGNIETARQMFDNGLTRPTILGLLEKPRYIIGLAFVALAQNHLDDAAKNMQAAREYVQAHTMAHVEPFLDWADAQVSAARGDAKHALELYARAESRAVEMEMRPLLWQVRAGAANVLAAAGRQDEAKVKRQAAHVVVDEIAGLFANDKMRDSFVESATKKIDG